MTEYVLYATKVGARDWEEEVIAVDTRPMHEGELKLARLVLAEKGYDRVRIAAINLSVAPDFAGTVNV